MSTTKFPDTEFYIGWMPQAPGTYSKHVRKVVIVLVFLVLIVATILSIQQKKFSTSTFEFGQLTRVRGIYQSYPVPAVRVVTSGDAFGNKTYLTIPLVGYGKYGAEGVISQLENQHNISLVGEKVTLSGTLLYSDGKTFLQIDGNDKPLVSVEHSNVLDSIHTIKVLGNVQLTGEVVDPKCYFGVMKPGQGKPHRDCAIRCIAGGISPVFIARNSKGETEYYLILDQNGKKMNDALKDHVAEPISLQAKAVQYDDWKILYTSKESIHRTGGISFFKYTSPELISCSP